jgi:uncharacterized membrane protein YgaE (UPF0421/DUF939 family)
MKQNIELQLWHKITKRFSLLMSLKTALITVLCFYAGSYLSTLYHFPTPALGGLWCVISGIIVLQVFVAESFKAAWLRIIGSLIGAITSLIFSLFTSYSIISLGACVFCTVMIASAFKIKETFRLASLTVVIIFIVGMTDPTVPILLNAFSRFLESVTGAIIAIAMTMIFFPLRKKLHLLGR